MAFGTFSWNWSNNNDIFFTFVFSCHLHPVQVESYDNNSRIVVDADDSGKFRPDRVGDTILQIFLIFVLRICQLG